MQSALRIALFSVLSVTTLLYHGADGQATAARCTVVKGSGSGDVEGLVRLTQAAPGGEVTVVISLSGFNTSGPTLKRGFHVHANASLGNKCVEAAGHLNLNNRPHGAPTDPEPNRHTGDLGNVDVSSAGTVSVTITDHLISLSGTNSVIGKPIVIHSGEDDLGRGGAPTSNTTGNAGGRVGCCLIVLDSPDSSSAIQHLPSWTLLASLALSFQLFMNAQCRRI